MSEEEIIEEIPSVDLDEIGKRYEEKGYFKRLAAMFSGLGKPKNTAEYKLARIELQRQAAPLIAITAVLLLVTIMIVLTAMTGVNKDAYEVTIAEQTETPTDETPPPEPEPPPDIEVQPIDDIEITVDTTMPGPVMDAPPTPTPQNTEVTVKPADNNAVQFVDSPIKMKSMQASRNAGVRAKYVGGGKGYGNAITEATVMKVLWWLKGKQAEDGSWKGGSSAIANTALAVLTYLAHGEYPNSDSPFRKDFGPVVQKAIDHIRASVFTDSSGITRMKGTDGNEYAFLIATYALCEAYGMTKNPDCKETALLCLDRIIKGQSPTGGWDYKINPQSTRDDLSFAGWALQALKAGKMAGLHPDGLDECIKKAVRCLQTRSFYKDHFTYCANSRHHAGLTGTGCLALQLLGYGNKPEVRSALDFMKEWKPTLWRGNDEKDKDGTAGVAAGFPNTKNDCPSPQYYCYYATQCKYQAGMKQGAVKSDEIIWQEWNAAMIKLYPNAIKELPDKIKDSIGQEHKQGYFVNSDTWSSRPVMDSCLVALQLMVYYRYLPTTQTAAGATEDDAKPAADAAVGNNDVVVDVDI